MLCWPLFNVVTILLHLILIMLNNIVQFIVDSVEERGQHNIVKTLFQEVDNIFFLCTVYFFIYLTLNNGQHNIVHSCHMFLSKWTC